MKDSIVFHQPKKKEKENKVIKKNKLRKKMVTNLEPNLEQNNFWPNLHHLSVYIYPKKNILKKREAFAFKFVLTEANLLKETSEVVV